MIQSIDPLSSTCI